MPKRPKFTPQPVVRDEHGRIVVECAVCAKPPTPQVFVQAAFSTGDQALICHDCQAEQVRINRRDMIERVFKEFMASMYMRPSHPTGVSIGAAHAR